MQTIIGCAIFNSLYEMAHNKKTENTRRNKKHK